MDEELENVVTNESMNEEEVTNEVAPDARDEQIEQLKKALNAERAEKKTLKKQLQDLSKEEEEEIQRAEEDIRKKLKNGKSELNDDVIEDLMNTFGKAQAKNQVKSARKETEREIMELKRNPLYMDIEEYGVDIRKLMKSGLTAEQAYWAVAGATKYSSKKTEEKTAEEQETNKQLNKERASQGYVNVTTAGEEKKPSYSEKEKAISRATGVSEEEVKVRSGALDINQILEANRKFKR